MPATYTLIASNTLSSAAASVTFSSIPATYTDLIVRCTVRSTRASTATDSIRVRLNSATTSYSARTLRGWTDGTTIQLQSSTGNSAYITTYSPIASSTASTFSSTELYIPNYAGSTNKPLSVFSVSEDNTTTTPANAWQVYADASLWSNTAAITSIEFTSANSANIDSGSSFFLYGIRNS